MTVGPPPWAGVQKHEPGTSFSFRLFAGAERWRSSGIDSPESGGLRAVEHLGPEHAAKLAHSRPGAGLRFGDPTPNRAAAPVAQPARVDVDESSELAQSVFPAAPTSSRRSRRASDRLQQGLGGIYSVTEAAAKLPCSDAVARRWLRETGLVSSGPGGKELVAWAAVVAHLSPAPPLATGEAATRGSRREPPHIRRRS